MSALSHSAAIATTNANGASPSGMGAATGAFAPAFPSVSPAQIMASNAWYRQRPPLQFQDARIPFSLSASRAALEPRDGVHATVQFRIGEAPASLIAPHQLLAAIAGEFGVDYRAVGASTVLLLVEHRWTAFLTRMEHLLNAEIIPVGLANVPLAVSGTDAAALDVILEFLGEAHLFRLLLPPNIARGFAAWLGALPVQPPSAETYPVSAALRVGRARITLAELGNLRLGDVVLVETPLTPSELMAVFGERHAARARREGTRIVIQENATRLSGEQEKVWCMSEKANEGIGAAQFDGVLDDIQIGLTFELGREEIELKLLRQIGEGYVFELHRDPRTAVDILAGSRRIGQGELVLVNETLGVRVTRLFDHG